MHFLLPLLLLVLQAPEIAEAQIADQATQLALPVTIQPGIEPGPSLSEFGAADTIIRDTLPLDSDGPGLDVACCFSTITTPIVQSIDCNSVITNATEWENCIGLANGRIVYLDHIEWSPCTFGPPCGPGDYSWSFGLDSFGRRGYMISKKDLRELAGNDRFVIAFLHLNAIAFLNQVPGFTVGFGLDANGIITGSQTACDFVRLIPPAVPNPLLDCPCIDPQGGANATAATDGEVCDHSPLCKTCFQGLCNVIEIADADSDGQADLCDQCPLDPDNDADNDMICGDVDNCPAKANTSQDNSDMDPVGDACDNCPTTTNTTQHDADSDMIGDACDFLFYAALGDSYSSGEGVPPYETGTAVPPGSAAPENGCHRAIPSLPILPGPYPHLVRDPPDLEVIATPTPGSPSFDFDFLACSGALTRNVGFSTNPMDGQYPGTPDELTQLSRGEVTSSTHLVTITIGGNDAAFADFMRSCVFDADCRLTEAAPGVTWQQIIPQFLNDVLGDRLVDLYQEIKDTSAPSSVFVLGYPRLVAGATIQNPTGLCPALNRVFGTLQISLDEQIFIRNMSDLMNAVIQQAAAQVGVQYVQVSGKDIRGQFNTHDACGDGDDWIYGISIPGPDGSGDRFALRSFHPTLEGQVAYADLVNEYVQDKRINGSTTGFFDNGLPKNPNPVPPPSPIASVSAVPPPTIGTLRVEPVNPPPCPTGYLFVVGQLARLVGDGFAPNESVSVEFSFPGGATNEVGPVLAAADGSLDAEVAVPAIPASLAPIALIKVRGSGANGGGIILVSEILLVTDDPTTDTDSDGVPDACDKCPQDYDPDQADDDVDGRGNVCDVCPLDPQNDVDDDSLCFPEDTKPFDPDNDGDGVLGRDDNCVLKANPDQRDTNLDGFGNACDADYDNLPAAMMTVASPDFVMLSFAFGSVPGDQNYNPDVDITNNGIFAPEFILLSNQFGGPPGPSGLPCAGTIPCTAGP